MNLRPPGPALDSRQLVQASRYSLAPLRNTSSIERIVIKLPHFLLIDPQIDHTKQLFLSKADVQPEIQ